MGSDSANGALDTKVRLVFECTIIKNLRNSIGEELRLSAHDFWLHAYDMMVCCWAGRVSC